jgi:hypothetical protein
MRTLSFDPQALRKHLLHDKIATLPELKNTLGTTTDLTVFRKLKLLDYLSSYTHRGRYYTLREVACFDDAGLWSQDGVWFSRYGTLVATLEAFVNQAPGGWFADELAAILHAEVQDPLHDLVRAERLRRSKMAGRFLYTSADSRQARDQLRTRQTAQSVPLGAAACHNPRHGELLTGHSLQGLSTAARPRDQLGEKLTTWGVRPDDPDADAVRRRLARIQLSFEDQFWLLQTAEHIAKAEKAKAVWNPKAQTGQYISLGKIATAAARLIKGISEVFPPPWTDERARMDSLVAELDALIEGTLAATMIINKETAVSLASLMVKSMRQRRCSPKGRVHWELLQDLIWLASAKPGGRISERSVRRYLEDQRRSRSPVRAYWRRNSKLLQEAVRLNPLPKPASPNWVYGPREVDGGASKAIEAFTGIARQHLESFDPPNSQAAKAAKKRS